jgi:ketosteroid isomerase-like protein
VYAADGRLLLPSSAPLDGRPAIEAFWRAGLDAGMVSINLAPRSVEADSTFACEVGRYTLHAEPRDERPVIEEGGYLIVHRVQADGGWLRALEVYSPDADA